MLVFIVLLWVALIWWKGHWGATIFVAILAYPVLAIAFNAEELLVRRGLVELHTRPFPVPRGRRTLLAAEIDVVFCDLIRPIVGRGGRAEWWVLMASTHSGPKPVPLLDIGSKEDAAKLARIVVRRLNELRPPGSGQVRSLDL